jgi:branched-chain amino acid transport system substrate-binding protein
MYSKPNVPYTQGMIVLFRSAVHVVAAAAIACTAVGAGPASPSDPIKIGVILPLTGSSAGVAQDLLRGIQLAFSENGNTVSGRKVEIVTADDQNTPATALTEARRLVENDKVSLLMGSLNSSVALTLLPYAVRSQVPYITTTIAAEITGSKKSPYAFRSAAAAGQMERPLAWLLHRRGFKSVILMGSDYVAGHDSTGMVGAQFTALGGSIVKSIFPPQGDTDYGPYFSTLGDAKADLIYGYFFGGDTLRFVRQYRSFGVTQQLAMSASTISAAGVAQSLGKDVDGILTAELWSPTLTDPLTIAFEKSFQKAYGDSPQATARSGYVEGRLVVTAIGILKGNVPNGLAFAQALHDSHFKEPGGEMFSFDENNNATVSTRLVRWQFVDGKATGKVLETIGGVTQDWKAPR